MKLMHLLCGIVTAALLCSAPVISADNAPDVTDLPAVSTEEAVALPELRLDNQNRYLYMSESYAQGYVPTVEGGYAVVVVPLRCDENAPASLHVSAGIDVSDASPFVTKNYEETVFRVQNAVNDSAETVESYHIVFWLALRGDRMNGSYPVTIHAEGGGAQYDTTVYVSITDGKDPNAVTTEPPVTTEPAEPVIFAPKLLLDHYDTGGAVTAGDTLHLSVTLRNTALDQGLRNLTVTASAPQNAFSPMSQSQTKYIAETAAGSSFDVAFDYTVLPNTPAGQYEIPLHFDFASENGMTGAGDASVTVEVVQPLEMKFPTVVFPTEATVSDTLQIPVQAINLSLADAKNVYAELSGNGLLPQGAAFFGDLAAGAEMTVTLPVQITSLSGGESLYGQTEGTFTFHYSDLNGKEYTETQVFSVSLKSPFTQSGNPSQEAASPHYWIAAVSALGIAALALIVYLFIRYKRRHAS